MKIICDIYKGDKKEEMYLYVSKQDALERVQEALRQSLGERKFGHHYNVNSIAKASTGRR